MRLPKLLLRLILLPFRLLGYLLRRLMGVVIWLASPLIAHFDASPRLSKLIDSLSSAMATQRGLPLLVGTVLLVLSWITHGIILMVMVSTKSFDHQLYWLCIPFTMLHLGVLAGFTGAMLATPLGQGYKDK